MESDHLCLGTLLTDPLIPHTHTAVGNHPTDEREGLSRHVLVDILMWSTLRGTDIRHHSLPVCIAYTGNP